MRYKSFSFRLESLFLKFLAGYDNSAEWNRKEGLRRGRDLSTMVDS